MLLWCANDIAQWMNNMQDVPVRLDLPTRIMVGKIWDGSQDCWLLLVRKV